MATVFTRIIEGDLPARFVWKDEICVAFLSINPIRAGHTLVVPREEVDHWLDASPDTMTHLINVSRSIGEAIQRAYEPEKVGLMLAGLEVPHLHVHLLPVDDLRDLSFEYAEKDPDPDSMDEAAQRIRQALEELGFEQVGR